MSRDSGSQTGPGHLPIRIGISSCLLGEKVRFDSGHKHDRYITDVLGAFFEFVMVCPEIEVGMGVPREAVRLEGDPDVPRMAGGRTGADWTDRMNRYSHQRVHRQDLADLSGFILKSRSPSCGMERVRVYVTPNTVRKSGAGLFARALRNRFPHLPVEEEGRLSDVGLRENFIVRVFAYHRLQRLFAAGFSRGAVVQFHAAHKYLLLAHSPAHYGRLGRLVAGVKGRAAADFKEQYRAQFMDALRHRATVKKNVNVLQHITGFLRDHLTAAERDSVAESIADYRKKLVPLIVPITLVHHFVHLHDIEYIRDQVYLRPHPKELMLRNHV